MSYKLKLMYTSVPRGKKLNLNPSTDGMYMYTTTPFIKI